MRRVAAALGWQDRRRARVAKDGSYRLRLRVAGALRTLPVFVVVDTKPPRFRATLSRTKLVPLGYTVDDKTVVSWRSAEQLFQITVVARLGSRTQKVLVQRHSKSGSVDWPRTTCDPSGKCHRSKAAEGDWKLQLVASDQAGNAATVGLGTVQVVAPQ